MMMTDFDPRSDIDPTEARRCVECDYRLNAHGAGDVCPECGTVIRAIATVGSPHASPAEWTVIAVGGVQVAYLLFLTLAILVLLVWPNIESAWIWCVALAVGVTLVVLARSRPRGWTIGPAMMVGVVLCAVGLGIFHAAAWWLLYPID